jgi:hypothetical protein
MRAALRTSYDALLAQMLTGPVSVEIYYKGGKQIS